MRRVMACRTQLFVSPPPLAARALGCLLGCALGAAVGCSAGYAPPNGPDDRLNDDVARRRAQLSTARAAARAASTGDVSTETENLEAELSFGDVSKLILRSVRAHGGWDAWRHSGKLVITRVREAVAAPAGQDGSPPPPATERIEIVVGPDGRVAPPASPEASRETILVALPFLLTDPTWSKSYLGVESDAGSGAAFEKVRFRPPATWPSIGDASRWVTAYFDAGTLVLRRVAAMDGSRYVVLELSDGTELGGLQLATRRKIWFLRSRFDHWDPKKPDAVETVEATRFASP